MSSFSEAPEVSGGLFDENEDERIYNSAGCIFLNIALAAAGFGSHVTSAVAADSVTGDLRTDD
jgi:hypothetical protein